MACTLAEVLRRFGPAYLAEHAPSTAQARAWRDIISCRTAALGGERLVCDCCGTTQWRYHCCGNRHCPQCQARQRDAWRAQRLLELLPVPYCHLVFTLPHELNALTAVHRLAGLHKDGWSIARYDGGVVQMVKSRRTAARPSVAQRRGAGTGVGAVQLDRGGRGP